MRNFFNLLILSLAFGAQSQTLTNHPISYYGIGEIGQQSHSIYDALGRSYVSYFDSSQLNVFNPSTYSNLTTGNTLLSIGINARASQYSQDAVKSNQIFALADHFALGFKMKKRMGLAFGLKPYAKRGYAFSETIYTGLDSLKYNYNGRGSVSNFFIGFSFALVQTKNSYLAIGANANYLFGNVYNDRSSILISNTSYSGGLSSSSFLVKTIHLDFGFSYKQQFGKHYQMSLGGTIDPSQKLNTTYVSAFYTSNNMSDPTQYDTLSTVTYSGHVISGLTYSIGMSNRFFFDAWKRKARTLHPNLMLNLSYSFKSGFTHDFDSIAAWNSGNGQHFGIGIQFCPESKIYENIASLKAFDKLSYRIGAYRDQLPYFKDQIQYVDKGLTIGVGIPILAQQSLSTLNFGISLGQRGTFSAGHLMESYVGINFGVILSPARFEPWFRKRKLD